jgi:acetyl esterase
VAVTPEVKMVLTAIEAAAVPLSQQSPEDLRQAYSAMAAMAAKEDVRSVMDRTIPGPGGDIPVRVYVPTQAASAVSDGTGAPVLVWFHGGGWVIGDLETADGTARALANAADVVVVSVDYRLAPENRFPAAFDDAMAAIQWVVDKGEELGLDPSRLAVGGDSAGGNLAAVACQQLRDSGPPIRFQLLVYPVTDARLSSPSIDENAEGYFLTREVMLWFRDHYLGDRDRDDPRVSPLRASEEALTGVAPALVITAEYDPLRDEGEAYGDRLRAAGVDCEVTRYDSMIHGFFSMKDLIPEGGLAITQAAQALRSALRSDV